MLDGKPGYSIYRSAAEFGRHRRKKNNNIADIDKDSTHLSDEVSKVA